MRYIDYGFLGLKASALRQEKRDKFDLADLLEQLSKSKKLAGYEVNQRFLEIGSLSGLEEFRSYLAPLI